MAILLPWARHLDVGWGGTNDWGAWPWVQTASPVCIMSFGASTWHFASQLAHVSFFGWEGGAFSGMVSFLFYACFCFSVNYGGGGRGGGGGRVHWVRLGLGDTFLSQMMILQRFRHPISCIGVCYANTPQKPGHMALVPALDLTVLFQVILCKGDLLKAIELSFILTDQWSQPIESPARTPPYTFWLGNDVG